MENINKVKSICGGLSLLASLMGTIYPLRVKAQAWSADGQQIAIGGPSLIVADARSMGATPGPDATPNKNAAPPIASGATPLVVLPSIGAAYSPAWSRTGTQIAYIAEGTGLNLYDTTRRTSRPIIKAAITKIDTNFLPRDLVSPADTNLFATVQRSASGKLEALIRYINNQVFLPPIELPFSSIPSNFQAVATVPNTANVIVAGGDNGKFDLYLLDQTDVVKLTNTGDVLGFGVSSDGSRVRWVRASPNTRHILLQIYELAIDTRSLKKLPYPDRITLVNPNPRNAPSSISSVVFSPDLNHFAFIAHGGPQANPNGTALWISDIGGTEVHLVGSGTNATAPSGGVPASAQQVTGTSFPYFVPSFSPDSRSFAAVRNENGKRYLFVGNTATGRGKGTPLP